MAEWKNDCVTQNHVRRCTCLYEYICTARAKFKNLGGVSHNSCYLYRYRTRLRFATASVIRVLAREKRVLKNTTAKTVRV